MRTIAINGANGFIGKCLCQFYLDRGDRVIAITRGKEKDDLRQKKGNLKIVFAKYEEYKNMDQLIGEEIDSFYYLAWSGYGTATNDYNVQTSNIPFICDTIKAISKMKCKKMIFIGTCQQFQYEEIGNGVRQKSSVYGAAKTYGEALGKIEAAKYKMEFCTAIFSNVFGVGDRSARSTNKIIRSFLNNKCPLLIDGETLFDWTYIDDALEGLALINEKGKNGQCYYIGGEKARKFSDIISDVRDVVNHELVLSYGTLIDKKYIDYSEIDKKNAKKDLGFMAKSDFKESIKKTMEWVIREALGE